MDNYEEEETNKRMTTGPDYYNQADDIQDIRKQEEEELKRRMEEFNNIINESRMELNVDSLDHSFTHSE